MCALQGDIWRVETVTMRRKGANGGWGNRGDDARATWKALVAALIVTSSALRHSGSHLTTTFVCVSTNPLGYFDLGATI